ncbi:hypothetical protein SAMN02745857_00427 [Andreprevotia lacus DSM 23236]|uniref:Uncharacterized protein n=1 Tax=Andreprevotia lacus DSM 23236 TaxID=1121001 RepID=A0A1W1X1P6_9NEIS|nr:hypothetical protein [Andreprevotia lacus]SMC17886.1 hypothetical protein SAMN02745857_00427 [Andreprevotia lacus DSM 23236]
MLKLATPLLALLVSTSVMASSYTDAVSRCLADNTTGRDRKDLAAWIYGIMSAHPYVRETFNAPAVDRKAITQRAGALYTRLIAESCRNEFKAALDAEGLDTTRTAFRYLGELAMTELMSDAAVKKAMGEIEYTVDTKRLEAALK